MLNELAKEIVRINTENGFSGKREVGMLLALIHSEVSEALEEYRNGHEINETYYNIVGITPYHSGDRKPEEC